jgi:hypothetical protein
LILAPNSARALVITFNDVGGVAPGSPIGNAFDAAAKLWTDRLSDPVTLKFNVGYVALTGPNATALAEAESVTVDVPYDTVKQALIDDRTTADDFLAVTTLQAGATLEFFTNDSNGNRVEDRDGSVNNGVLRITRPNAKALGLLPGDALADATIRFNTAFSAQFDFDRTDGIAAGTYDVVGLAAHEIGHALGFVSGVDWVDYYSLPNGGGAPFDLNATPEFSVLDLFRYTQDSAAAGHLLDLAFGGEPYFSLDTGMTSLGRFANGAYNGTGGDASGAGDQASHWWDFPDSIGLMDPTSEPFGKLNVISTLDVIAFDVIGWDRVPEPATVSLLAIGLLAGALSFRTRRS